MKLVLQPAIYGIFLLGKSQEHGLKEAKQFGGLVFLNRFQIVFIKHCNTTCKKCYLIIHTYSSACGIRECSVALFCWWCVSLFGHCWLLCTYFCTCFSSTGGQSWLWALPVLAPRLPTALALSKSAQFKLGSFLLSPSKSVKTMWKAVVTPLDKAGLCPRVEYPQRLLCGLTCPHVLR